MATTNRERVGNALSYNGLVQSWPEMTRLAREGAQEQQAAFLSQGHPSTQGS